ncbi:MAG: hypothetical protein ACUVRZ_03000 [Desulfobacca sp.]|uniref:hypothetical protein n=1 Tax=Desulfobacca sp. TaxID=2067990 RepID=UPI004049BF88
MANRSARLPVLWLSGAVTFVIGVLLAQCNGYPLQPPRTGGLALLLVSLQAAVLWRLTWGRAVGGGLVLGLLPLYLGFYGQSRHWVSEVWILGLFLSLAASNALLADRWFQEWQRLALSPTAAPPGGAPRALAFTLVNILLICGLLGIWYFPANPLPGRDGAWLVALTAVGNQELIKRRYYASFRGSLILAWSAAGCHLLLVAWLLLVFIRRAGA